MDGAISSRAVPLPDETPADCVARISDLATVRRTEFDGGAMVWRSWGSGSPLVLLHGGYGAWSHWIRNVLPLSERYRVIAPDLPSHGDSDALPGRPSRDVMTAAVARGLREVVAADQDYDLVGFSLGANLSAAIAAAHGGALRKLVTVGAGGLGVSSGKIEGLLKWRPDMPHEELNRRHRNNLGIIMIHDEARIDPLAVHLQRENGLRMRFRILRAGITTTLREHLPSVTAPLGCIWGEHDAYARRGRNERVAVMRRSHPDLDLTVIPDSAHWVMYERPDAFNAALLRTLRDAFTSNGG